MENLGIDTPKLLAQIVIFAIIYMVLSKYAFGPVTQILETRRRRIAEGEENLKKTQENLASSQEKAQALVDKANADADRLVKEARESAVQLAEAERQNAVNEAAAIISKAREASELERARIMGELKRDFGRLVVEATSKVSGKTLNDEDQARLSRETLSHISNN